MIAVAIILAQSALMSERVSGEHTFTVTSELKAVCDAILTSRQLQKMIHDHHPHYVGFDRYPNRGYAVCQVRIAHISRVRDVVLMIQVWAGDGETTVKLSSSYTVPTSRFGGIVRSVAIRRFAREMKQQEKMIRAELTMLPASFLLTPLAFRHIRLDVFRSLVQPLIHRRQLPP